MELNSEGPGAPGGLVSRKGKGEDAVAKNGSKKGLFSHETSKKGVFSG
jgi:hypothetical protein